MMGTERDPLTGYAAGVKGKMMIYELRIYRCVPGRQPALLSRFHHFTLRILGKARHPPARVLDHIDR